MRQAEQWAGEGLQGFVVLQAGGDEDGAVGGGLGEAACGIAQHGVAGGGMEADAAENKTGHEQDDGNAAAESGVGPGCV